MGLGAWRGTTIGWPHVSQNWMHIGEFFFPQFKDFFETPYHTVLSHAGRTSFRRDKKPFHFGTQCDSISYSLPLRSCLGRRGSKFLYLYFIFGKTAHTHFYTRSWPHTFPHVSSIQRTGRLNPNTPPTSPHPTRTYPYTV